MKEGIKVKKRLEKIISKLVNRIFLTAICIIVFGIVGVSAANMIASSEVSYDNTNSGATSTTVKDAIDELYQKTESNANLRYDEETHQVLVYNTTLQQFVPIAKLPSIPLSNVYLYNNGDYCDWITGGWESVRTISMDSEISFTIANGSSSTVAYVNAYTNNTIDITNYNELHIVHYESKDTDGAWGSVNLTNNPTVTGKAVKNVNIVGSTTPTETVIDITELIGEYNVQITSSAWSGYSNDFHIQEIWLS